jgi:hypothetical protein
MDACLQKQVAFSERILKNEEEGQESMPIWQISYRK